MNEAEIYSIIVEGNVPRSAAINMIKAYGNRKTIEALEEAKNTIPGASQSLVEREISTRFDSCLEMLDKFSRDSINFARNETNEILS